MTDDEELAAIRDELQQLKLAREALQRRFQRLDGEYTARQAKLRARRDELVAFQEWRRAKAAP